MGYRVVLGRCLVYDEGWMPETAPMGFVLHAMERSCGMRFKVLVADFGLGIAFFFNEHSRIIDDHELCAL